jgi:hypothetical protein
MTKNDMARVIAQALFQMPALAPADNWKVEQLAKLRKEDLVDQYNLAATILEKRNG